MMTNNNDRAAYIYNIDQCNFYITSGLAPIGAGVGKLGDVFIKFEKNALYHTLFAQWCGRTA